MSVDSAIGILFKVGLDLEKADLYFSKFSEAKKWSFTT